MLLRGLLLGLTLAGLLLAASVVLAPRARPLITGSLASRVVYLQGAFHVMSARPWFGTGLGTFGLAYEAMKPVERIEHQHDAVHAHNTLAELGAELGILGLVCVLLFFWKVWQEIAVALYEPVNAEILALQRGLAIGLLAFFLHSVVEQTFFEPMLIPLWWLGLGLFTGARSREAATPTRGEVRGRSLAHLGLIVLASSVSVLLTIRFIAADAWAMRGNFFWLTHQPEAGWEALARAQRWDPWTHRFPLESGERRLASVQNASTTDPHRGLEAAEAQFERSVTLSPWLGVGWLHLGITRWQLGKFQDAVVAMQQAQRWSPNSRVVMAHLARMWLAMGRVDEARTLAAHLQRLEPVNPTGFMLEAMVWRARRQPMRAAEAYEILLARTPTYAPAWFNLAQLLEIEGHDGGAAAAYRAVMRVAPPNRQDLRDAATTALSVLSATTPP